MPVVKKMSRIIVVLFALMASSGIVLHAGHLDADHLSKSPTHQCGVCHTATMPAVPVVNLWGPTFIESTYIFVPKSVVLSTSLLSGEDSRGPPLL